MLLRVHRMFEKPPGPRHTATEGADGLVIRIPARRNTFVVAFLTVWLCGWAVGEVMAPIGMFSAARKEPAAAVFMLVWICMWTVGGAFAIYIWLWMVRGYEVITVSPTALSIKREIFGYGRTKHYDVTEIRQLRVSPFTFNPFDFRSGMAFWGIGGGTLAFDYGYKTFRFAAGVDEAEARIILKAIVDRVPRLVEANVT